MRLDEIYKSPRNGNVGGASDEQVFAPDLLLDNIRKALVNDIPHAIRLGGRVDSEDKAVSELGL
jgi:hypothetical protein